MNIIQSILLSALAVFANNSADSKTSAGDSNIWDDKDENIKGLAKKRTFHNVIRMCQSGRLMNIAQHCSHASHSSHSSHSSHYSSSGNVSGGAPQTTTSVNSAYSSTGMNREAEVQPRLPRKAGSYKLGDTNLKKGDYGKDVDELITLLKGQKLLRNYKLKKKNGYTLFDNQIEDAVKVVQRQFNMTESGIVTQTFVEKLRKMTKK